MNSPHTGFPRMCPQERLYRHQLPDGRLTESYTALTVGLVLISRHLVRKSSTDEMGVLAVLIHNLLDRCRDS